MHETLLSALTPQRRQVAEQSRIISPDFRKYPKVKRGFDVLHAAIGRLEVMHLHYRNEKGEISTRHAHPLGLSFWGEVWVLIAWCEVRDGSRCFRVDRCLAISNACRRFTARRDRSLEDFIRLQQQKKTAKA